MAINLKDLVKEEPPKCYQESYYHLSGLHICKEFSKEIYYVIPNNEFRNLSDIDIYKKNREKHNSFESALEETNQIVEFANTRGAQDARFIQKRRGSNYKVNSSDDSEEDQIETKITTGKDPFRRINIKNKNIKEFNKRDIKNISNNQKKSNFNDLPFNKNLITDNFFESKDSLPIILEKDFEKVIEIDSYILETGDCGINGIDSTSRMPTNWEVFGKFLNDQWSLLDRQKIKKNWEANESRVYKLKNKPVKLSKIRLVIKDSEVGNIVSLSSFKVINNNYHSNNIQIEKEDAEIIAKLKNKLQKLQKLQTIFDKYIFYKIYQKLKNSSRFTPLKKILTSNQKDLIKRYAKLLFKLLDKKYYKSKIKNLLPHKKRSVSNGLLTYNSDGFENYFLAKEIDVEEDFGKRYEENDSYVFLANDSAATNELTAELKSHNIIKLNQKLYCVVKQGTPLRPDELESGEHIKNKEIGTFTNERDAVDWIYSNLNNEEVGISIDKAPKLVDTLINKNDIEIRNDLYFYQGMYILIPSFYGIKKRSLGNELSDLKKFKEKYSQVSIADDKDFIKEIFKTRDTLPEKINYKNHKYTIYKDSNCMLLRDNLNKLNYDLLNIDSISKLSYELRQEIKQLILEFDKQEFLLNKDKEKITQKHNIINQIGEMYIVENEGYFIAIRHKYLEGFPENDYINDIETRYDVSISVIEDYCKSLL
tara:strand:- start:23339 stop:25456 length:2118 start_codon:yes stop_codon:yes gene_type:complete